MGLDDYVAEKEQTLISEGSDVAIKFYQERGTSGKLLLILIVVIVIGLLLWAVGSTVVGFMYTTGGLLLIAMTIIAVGIYLYMRSQGVGLKSWVGGLVEIFIIVFCFIVYMGLLDSLMLAFFQVMPIIIIGGIGWVGYKWYKAQQDENLKKGVLILVVSAIIIFPVFEVFVVPYTIGRPVELEVQVMKDENGNWDAFAVMDDFSLPQTMTITANPYLNSMAEVSHWMWTEVNSVEKAYVTITVQDDLSREVIYSENNHAVYVANDDIEYIWGVIHLPPDVEKYVQYPFRIIVVVEDAGGDTLAYYSAVYYTDR